MEDGGNAECGVVEDGRWPTGRGPLILAKVQIRRLRVMTRQNQFYR
jgi:hypothetical protein